MGLDITAYRKIEPAPDAELEDGLPKEWADFAFFHPASLEFTEENWPGRSGGVKPGAYRFAERFGFRAGSYSGYGEWRRDLALMAFDKPIERVWEDCDHGPFLELISFADNEGVIAGEAAAKLARDFAENFDKALKFAKEREMGDWFLQQYEHWWKAFRLASDGGAVDFH